MKKIAILKTIHKTKKRRYSHRLFLHIIGIFFGIYCFVTVLPILWSVLTSFKDPYEYILNKSPFPKVWHFSNYLIAFKELSYDYFNISIGATVRYSFLNMFFYSVIMASLAAAMGVLLPLLLAYPISQYSFPGRKFLINLNIVVMILPIVGSLPAELQIRKALGLYDNLIPLRLTAGSGFGMNLLILLSYFKSLPKEYREAAVLDGAGHMSVMTKIYLPLIIPVLTAIFMLGFIGSWNNYMTTIIWLPSYPNLAFGVYMFSRLSYTKDINQPQVLAGFVLVSIPSIVLWSVSQNLVAKHLRVGGLKG